MRNGRYDTVLQSLGPDKHTPEGCSSNWLALLCRTLVCIREEFSRKGPLYTPALQVCLPIASLLVDGISSNLAHIFSSPGKIF